MERVGAKMYGAFWCSHCAEQKAAFGAGAPIPYVECFPEGYRKGVQLAPACKAAKLEGFPTWTLPDGTKARRGCSGLLCATSGTTDAPIRACSAQLEGDQTLEKLAELTGYDGPALQPPAADDEAP